MIKIEPNKFFYQYKILIIISILLFIGFFATSFFSYKIATDLAKNELKYKLIGYFEPGENNWVLKKGENPFFDSLLDLYEYNKESDRWLKKN